MGHIGRLCWPPRHHKPCRCEHQLDWICTYGDVRDDGEGLTASLARGVRAGKQWEMKVELTGC